MNLGDPTNQHPFTANRFPAIAVRNQPSQVVLLDGFDTIFGGCSETQSLAADDSAEPSRSNQWGDLLWWYVVVPSPSKGPVELSRSLKGYDSLDGPLLLLILVGSIAFTLDIFIHTIYPSSSIIIPVLSDCDA